jgi:hypothetical protein
MLIMDNVLEPIIHFNNILSLNNAHNSNTGYIIIVETGRNIFKDDCLSVRRLFQALNLIQMKHVSFSGIPDLNISCVIGHRLAWLSSASPSKCRDSFTQTVTSHVGSISDTCYTSVFGCWRVNGRRNTNFAHAYVPIESLIIAVHPGLITRP